MTTTTTARKQYTGRDMFAVLDVVEVESLPYEYNRGLPVGERRSWREVGEIRTMTFLDVEDGIDYAGHLLGRDGTVVHSRKCEAYFERDGKTFCLKFRKACDRTGEPKWLSEVLATSELANLHA